MARLDKAGFNGTVLTLKVRFADFTQITRSLSGIPRQHDTATLLRYTHDLIDKADIEGRPIRLMGLTVSKATKDENRAANTRQLLIDFDDI